jgi:BlaI family penicillinase repressor
MGKSGHDLGAGELDVLKVLWDLGPAPVRDVMKALHKRGRRVAYTTVLTVLTRLEQKGFVSSDKSEQAYIYKAKVSRDRATGSWLKSMVRQWFDGAAAPMVLQLMQSEKFSAEEIAQLQQLLDRLESKG